MELAMTQTPAFTARARDGVRVADRRTRKRAACAFACALAALASVPALAAFHLFRIDQVYSNADGTVQYVVMREATGSNGESFWAGNPLTTTSGGTTKQFTFPANLPSTATASRSVLIATPGFAALGLVAPDYTIPNGFIPRAGGTLNYANVDAIALPALPADGATAVDRNGAPLPATPKNFAGNSATLTAAPPPVATVDLDQHGLTGSWFNAGESGQGAEIEFFPDLAAPGSALVFGAWFTYDIGAPGGADHQRWYTFSGNGTRGATTIPITIAQNVGGNFATGPVTTSTVVGSGALAFGDCNDGALTYAFTDGSGRSGTIPMTRLTPNVTCVAAGAAPTNADFSLSGNWFDPATSGQGFVFEVNPLAPVAFFAWYTYSPTGQAAGAAGQRWYTGQGAFTPGSRTMGLTLVETTGGVFDRPTPAGQRSVAVGTASVTFMSCTAAELTYDFTGGTSAGRSGTIMLRRVGPVLPGCAATQSAMDPLPPGMGYPPYGP
jgi:hypothetical protein